MKAIATALIQILAYIAKYFSDKQLLDSGKDKERLAILKEVNDCVKKAKEIRFKPVSDYDGKWLYKPTANDNE